MSRNSISRLQLAAAMRAAIAQTPNLNDDTGYTLDPATGQSRTDAFVVARPGEVHTDRPLTRRGSWGVLAKKRGDLRQGNPSIGAWARGGTGRIVHDVSDTFPRDPVQPNNIEFGKALVRAVQNDQDAIGEIGPSGYEGDIVVFGDRQPGQARTLQKGVDTYGRLTAHDRFKGMLGLP
jgi:hypothetical protein